MQDQLEDKQAILFISETIDVIFLSAAETSDIFSIHLVEQLKLMTNGWDSIFYQREHTYLSFTNLFKMMTHVSA